MSLTKRQNWDAMMEAQFGTREPMYDDGGSALEHYRRQLKEAQQTIRFKFNKGDKVSHKGKAATVIARQYFEYEFPMTEYSIKVDDELSYWVKEEELSVPQSVIGSREILEAL